MRMASSAAILSLGLFAGCNEPASKTPPAPPPAKSGIEIKAPGVDVKIDNGKVDVEAPGADVKVNEDGVDVKTPGADVKVDDK